VCVVGRSYPPEFYSWIEVPHVRELFEQIATETEEDFQRIIQTLEQFGVEVLRPEITEQELGSGPFPAPPMTPRDTMVMIGDRFFRHGLDWCEFYHNIRGSAWADYATVDQFLAQAPAWQIQEARALHQLDHVLRATQDHRYHDIFQRISQQGNVLCNPPDPMVNGAMVSRIGRDLYFGTHSYQDDVSTMQALLDQHFPHTRNHVVNTGGHSDGTYCPVCPGLIISLQDVPTYADTFPGWEVVYLPGQSWEQVQPFLELKKKNQGRWWIPGFEHDLHVIRVVETWLDHWVGYVEETVFDVNMLIVDPKNVMVFNQNDQVFEALHRRGITAHVVPFRHRYFWDGGIHCVTLDLDRCGPQQDFFPDRSQKI
jgi:hypothetical protein